MLKITGWFTNFSLPVSMYAHGCVTNCLSPDCSYRYPICVGHYITLTILCWQWDLVCEKDSVSRLSQSLVLGGMFLGALASPLADRFGRKPVHVIFNIGLLGVTFAMAFVKNLAGFLVLRFFVGTFQQVCMFTVYWMKGNSYRAICSFKWLHTNNTTEREVH